MNVLLTLSFWLALMMSCCGDTGSHEVESTTAEYDYSATADYDYTATFDYYYVTMVYQAEVHGKASGIDRLGLVLPLGLAVYQMWT